MTEEGHQLTGHSREALADLYKRMGAGSVMSGGPQLVADPLDEMLGAMVGGVGTVEPSRNTQQAMRHAAHSANQGRPQGVTHEERVQEWMDTFSSLTPDQVKEVEEALWTRQLEGDEDDFSGSLWGEENSE